MIEKTCKSCGSGFTVPPYRKETALYCSAACRRVAVAKANARPLSERFWEKVKVSAAHECWEWSGAKTHGGYGVIGFGSKTLLRAHRVSYEMHNGEISNGLVVRHACDNPSCVNPRHLAVRTQAQNMQDAVDRGRHKSPARKLSDKDVDDIINARAGVRETARAYGVSPALICNIRKGRRRAR